MEAYPDEEWVYRAAYPAGVDDEYEPREWHGMYWEAWDILRFDRHYDGYGGQGAVPYMVVRQYGIDIGFEVGSQDFWEFRLFFQILDSAWLSHVAEQRKKKEEEDKRRAEHG